MLVKITNILTKPSIIIINDHQDPVCVPEFSEKPQKQKYFSIYLPYWYYNYI